MVKSHRSGFTLMEMLVVTAIIALLTSMAVLSLRVLGVRDPAETDAKRFSTYLAIARELAELEQRHIGVQLDDAGYAFLVYSQRRREWSPLNERALPEMSWNSDVEPRLFIEGRSVVLDDTQEKRPRLGVDPDGDYTAFELEIRERGKPSGWRIAPAADGSLQLTPPSP